MEINNLFMIETHPFGSFVPTNAKYLVCGSFTGKEFYDSEKKMNYVWYYSNGGRNQFWPILEEVYERKLQTREEMCGLFTSLGMAMADIIYQCERVKTSNLDIHLTNIIYAVDEISKIVRENPIKKIFFTSRFTETKFHRVFKEIITKYPNIELVTLPSPSPRYVLMTKKQKIIKYGELLPKL